MNLRVILYDVASPLRAAGREARDSKLEIRVSIIPYTSIYTSFDNDKRQL